jgi:predicted dehydrogenase
MIGAGFWARYQLSGWREVGVNCIAICNRTIAKADALAREFRIPAVYSDADAMLDNERPDFVDVVTDVDTHRRYVEAAARRGIPVVCQKPLAPTLADAEAMTAACKFAGVPLLVNENWRWQVPIRQVKAALDSGAIGRPFRARIDMISGFPVFANQPFLRTLEQFILTDLGSHILDVARFLFGDADKLYCQTARVHTDILGEDVATVMLRMQSGATVLVEMGYAENHLERDRFPETFLFIEGERGSIELAPDFWLRVTTSEGTHARRCPPPRYPWADPAYDVVHSSIVPCQRNLADALHGRVAAETSAEDNLRTVRLVFAAYESARTGETVQL